MILRACNFTLHLPKGSIPDEGLEAKSLDSPSLDSKGPNATLMHAMSSYMFPYLTVSGTRACLPAS
jgi:hypothetical protein